MANKTRHYEWVSPKVDMPPDDPHNNGFSIPVKVRLDGTHIWPIAVYDYNIDEWVKCSSKRVINKKVLGWTNDYEAKEKK